MCKNVSLLLQTKFTEHKGITPVLKICVHRVFHVQTVTNFNAEKPHPERKPFYSHHVKEYK